MSARFASISVSRMKGLRLWSGAVTAFSGRLVMMRRSHSGVLRNSLVS